MMLQWTIMFLFWLYGITFELNYQTNEFILFQMGPPVAIKVQTSSQTDQLVMGPLELFGVLPTLGMAKESPSRNYPMFFRVLSAASECLEN